MAAGSSPAQQALLTAIYSSPSYAPFALRRPIAAAPPTGDGDTAGRTAFLGALVRELEGLQEDANRELTARMEEDAAREAAAGGAEGSSKAAGKGGKEGKKNGAGVVDEIKEEENYGEEVVEEDEDEG
jgi:hypothetical protein